MTDFSGFGNIVLDANEVDKRTTPNISNYAQEQLDRMANENNPKAFAKYLKEQEQLQKKKFGCASNGGGKFAPLSPEGVESAANTVIDAINRALEGLTQENICKHIEDDFSNRLKTAKEGISLGARLNKGIDETGKNIEKASKGGFWYVGGVTVKAVWTFIAGVITVLLPDPFKKWWIAVVKWINQATYSLLNFNWNISDGDINKQSLRWVSAAAGQSGELIGKSIGWIACGLSPVAGVAVFNPEQAALILADVGEEAIDEISQELFALANQVRRGLTNAVFLQLYKGIRSILRNPLNPFYVPLITLFGKERVDTWGTANSKPWSINIAVNEWIESFNNEGFENFLEELYEGTIEGCQEGFLTFANSASLNLVDRTNVDVKKTIEITAKEL